MAILYIFCLFAPMAAGQGASATDSNWKDKATTVIKNDGGGNGTSWTDAILIASAEELAYFAQQVNAGQPIEYGSDNATIGPGSYFIDYYFALSADINLSGHNWTPIGAGSNSFDGNFDGQGHCVSGLKVDVNGRSDVYAGLFGDADVGTIQNLGVCVAEKGIRGAGETGNICAGGIAGRAKNVHNCYVVGKDSIEITGGNLGHAGGIVGYLTSNGSLTNCYATVDIKVATTEERYAGGIVGTCDSNSTISYTYATGDVEAGTGTGTGTGTGYAGGICGYLRSMSTIQNSLALNRRIEGNDSFSNRIVGEQGESTTLNDNYASPVMLVNGNTSTDNLVDNKNGDNTWLSSFEADLKKEPTGDNNGWVMSWTFPSDYLPQLKKKITEDIYDEWSSKEPQPQLQLQLNANLYLPSRLYIVSSTGGTLKVTDKAGSPLTDGSAVMSGTVLELENYPKKDSVFITYLSGLEGSDLTNYSGLTIEMPNHDLYLSAKFIVYPRVYIQSPEGITLKVENAEGAPIYYGAPVHPGTPLMLKYEITQGYSFNYYLCGTSTTQLGKIDNNTYTMPDHDIWISASGWKDRATTVIKNDGGGKGTSWTDAILIASAEELVYFAQQMNAGQAIEYGSGNATIEPNSYFALSADINLSDHNWTPIGTDNNPFKGNFDGQGHCVSGLKVDVNGNGDVYAGLFGDAGTIQNLGVCVEGIRVAGETGNISAGGIAGRAKNVHNCYVVGEGSIEITGGNLGHAGGIVGNLTSDGSLTNCYATVKVVTNKEHRAGGIVGTCDSNSTISYTYATGDVEAGTGYAGGICGYLDSSSTIQNSLALNGRIEGNDSFSNRIVGDKESSATLNDNYASPVMLVNGNTSPDNLVDNKNGANTWLSSFKADLKKEPTGDGNGWVMSWTFPSDYLPQLKKKKKTADGYDVWSSEQLQLNANLYLPSRLYIVSPTGGTLTVTDEAGSPLTGDSAVMSGTQLNLANSEDTNYRFSEYLSGSSGDNLNSHASNSITMPDADLYLSATFTYQEPEPPYVPPVPVYYNVYLPQVEGATTDPGPGEHEVESWSTFRFYLTLDPDYSESQPVVTTDRGETLQPRSSDGAYLVKYVRSDVEVFIDGIFKNLPPVANEAIGTDGLVPQIWAEGSMLCIRMAEALPSTPIAIYTTDGRLHDSFASTPGLNCRQLPTNIYIVRIGDTACKVIIK